MKSLKVILWICGIGFMISFIFMVLPWSAIESLYRCFGETPIPDVPAANYLFRVTCMLVGLIGIYFIILAQNPAHYRTLLFFSAIGLISCGMICIIMGLIAGISPLFYVGDGLFGLILGIILAVLTSRALKSQTYTVEKLLKVSDDDINISISKGDNNYYVFYFQSHSSYLLGDNRIFCPVLHK